AKSILKGVEAAGAGVGPDFVALAARDMMKNSFYNS
ncbi:unnamed protein product, partial [Rotaria socialis]